MPIKICSKCGKEKKHHANGMCAACVQSERRKRYPDENARSLKKHYYKNHKEKLILARRYYWDDPIKRFVHATNMSSARRGRQGYIPRKEIETLFPNIFLGFPSTMCAYCNSTVVPGGNATLDHIDTDGLHALSNVVVACASCNSSRRNTPVDEFRVRLENDKDLQLHIVKRNDSILAGFLVERYQITTDEIMNLIKQRQLLSLSLTNP